MGKKMRESEQQHDEDDHTHDNDIMTDTSPDI